MKEQSTKTLDELPRKLLRFAELLVTGLSASKAAREVGFSKTTANSGAYRWVGKTREGSQYPFLYDYYEDLRKEKLRIYEVDASSITHELKLIAFSKIDNYLDLPSRATKEKIEKLEEQKYKLNVELEKHINPEYTKRRQENDLTNGVRVYLPSSKKVEDKIRKVEKKIRDARSGPGAYLRLKYIEEIPAELMPAIAEIKETKEGIAVKLHSKIDALDMLAKINRLYAAEAEGSETGIGAVKEVNIVVEGTKSRLMVSPREDPQKDQNAA